MKLEKTYQFGNSVKYTYRGIEIIGGKGKNKTTFHYHATVNGHNISSSALKPDARSKMSTVSITEQIDKLLREN